MVMENTSHVSREARGRSSRPHRQNDRPRCSVVVAWVIGPSFRYCFLPPRNVSCPQWLVLPEKDSHQTVHSCFEYRRDLVGESNSQLSVLYQVVKRGLPKTCCLFDLRPAAILLD